MRQGNYEDLETALFCWFREARNQNAPFSGPIMLEKAKFFAHPLGIDDFKQSTGWLERFKAICSESRSLDPERTAPEALFSSRHLQGRRDRVILQTYTRQDRRIKNVSCEGGKRSIDRITVMVCTNMSGEIKFRF